VADLLGAQRRARRDLAARLGVLGEAEQPQPTAAEPAPPPLPQGPMSGRPGRDPRAAFAEALRDELADALARR
jgi:hypothetical protein